MTLQEYKDKLADIEKKAEKARNKAYKEYLESVTDLRVGDKVKLVPLVNPNQAWANWEMEINAITPYIAYDKRTKKDAVEFITLVGTNPDGTREFYNWVSTQGDYELIKID